MELLKAIGIILGITVVAYIIGFCVNLYCGYLDSFVDQLFVGFMSVAALSHLLLAIMKLKDMVR